MSFALEMTDRSHCVLLNKNMSKFRPKPFLCGLNGTYYDKMLPFES